MDYESFLVWLKKGEQRAPRLYKGQSVAKEVPEVRKPVSIPMERLKEPIQNIEEVDYKLRAAGQGIDDGFDSVEDPE